MGETKEYRRGCAAIPADPVWTEPPEDEPREIDAAFASDPDMIAAIYCQTTLLANHFVSHVDQRFDNVAEDLDVLTAHIRGLTTVLLICLSILVGAVIAVVLAVAL